MAITAIVALAMIGGAAAQTPQDPVTGSATVRVETDPPGAPGNFTFTGVPGGTIVEGGMQDGIPMTIEFTWNLNSDEWIVGDLKSSVTRQGMTCNMTRPFELRHGGGQSALLRVSAGSRPGTRPTG